MPERGRLSEWNDERGFGFITPLDGEDRLFVHVSAFPRDKRRPVALDLVTFDRSCDERGRPRAVNVEFISHFGVERHHPDEAPVHFGVLVFEVVLIASFLSFVLIMVLTGQLPAALLGVYAVMSVVLFGVYGADKRAALDHRWRTRETTLHTLAILGGWPGALVAQTVFRHKTRKQPFRTIFWVTVALNCAVVAFVAVRGIPG